MSAAHIERHSAGELVSSIARRRDADSDSVCSRWRLAASSHRLQLLESLEKRVHVNYAGVLHRQIPEPLRHVAKDSHPVVNAKSLNKTVRASASDRSMRSGRRPNTCGAAEGAAERCRG